MPSRRLSISSAAGSRESAPQRPSEPRYTRIVWTLGLGAFGLAFSLTTTAVLAAVAAGYIVAAAGAGFLGGRFGLSRVIFVASFVYGFGLLLGGFGNEWHTWFLPIIFVVAIGGGTVLTLAWGLLFKLMPAADRGRSQGSRRPRRESGS